MPTVAATALGLLAGIDIADAWLATTDADSVVPANWLAHQVRIQRAGLHAWAGTVQVSDWSGHHPEVIGRYSRASTAKTAFTEALIAMLTGGEPGRICQRLQSMRRILRRRMWRGPGVAQRIAAGWAAGIGHLRSSCCHQRPARRSGQWRIR